MTPTEIGLIFTIIAGIIGIITFFIGRQSAAKNDGQEWGELKSDIRHIKGDIEEIKGTVGDSNRSLKESIRRLHKRIDDHERDYHNKIVTRSDDAEG